jgi:hypothetical protein
MAKFLDKDGKEVEAYTVEEFEAKKKEALDEYVKNNPDKSGELTAAQQALAEAQKKIQDLEGSGGDDAQKKRLKTERDDALKAVKDIETKLMNDMKALKDSVFGSKKTKILDALSGGDVEKRKKIEFEFDGFKGDVTNEVELEQRLVKAATLVNGTKPAPDFMNNMGDASKRGNGDHGGAKVESEESKAQRKAFGITDDMVKKYEPVINSDKK